MKRHSLIVSAVSAALLLSGCGSLTGFSNAKTDFACADLSGGPSCRNISQVYEENNPTTPVVLAASEEASDATFPETALDTASDTADDGEESTEPFTSCAAPSSLSETLVPASTI